MSRRSRNNNDTSTKASFTAEQVAGMMLEIGATLSHTWDALSPGEYNAALVGNQGQIIFDKMRRSDGQIGALEAIISLPVRAVKWSIEPGGTGKADQEAAALVESNLFDGMAITFDDLLSELLLAALLGFSAHETVMVEENGYVRWHTFADRAQTTVLEFTPSSRYPEPGIVQGGIDSTGKYQERFIPIDKLLIIEYCRRLGILRRSYKHWFMGDSTYRITNIGIENNLIGTIIATVTGGMSDLQQKKLLKSMEDIRARNVTGIIKPAGVDLSLLEASRSVIDALPYIEHHRTQVVVPALAQFLLLGHTNRGTQGLSENHSNIFMVAEHALANMIAARLNRNSIPQLCKLNFPGMKVYPKATHEHPSTVVDLDGVSYAISQLCGGQVLTADEDIENRVRSWYGLSELSSAKSTKSDGDEQAQDESGGSKPSPKVKASAPSSYDRMTGQQRLFLHDGWERTHSTEHDCTDHGEFADPDVSAIGRLFDQTADDFQARSGKLLGDMITKMERTVKPLLAKLDQSKPLQRAAVYPLLAKLELPGRDRYRAAVRDYLTTLVKAGREAAAEVQGKAVEPLSREETQYVTAQADLITERHLSEIKSLFCQQVLDGAATNVGVRQAVSDAAQASRDRLSNDFQSFFRDALINLVDHLGPDL